MLVAGTTSFSKGTKQHTSFLGVFSWPTRRPAIAVFKSPRRAQAQLCSRRVLRWVFTCTVCPSTKSEGAHASHIPIIPFYKRGCQDKCFPNGGKTKVKWSCRPARVR